MTGIGGTAGAEPAPPEPGVPAAASSGAAAREPGTRAEEGTGRPAASDAGSQAAQHDQALQDHQPAQPDTQPEAPVEQPEGADALLLDAVAVERQRDEYLGALQRLQADFENYRKRVQRQQEEMAARAAMALVRELLPTLDALDLARAHLAVVQGPDGEPDLSPDAQALVQARSLLLGSLEKGGLERLDAPGVPFDPEVHDAVAHAPEQDPAREDQDPQEPRGPVVDEVLRAGYRWQGQTLRPAMVRVRG